MMTDPTLKNMRLKSFKNFQALQKNILTNMRIYSFIYKQAFVYIHKNLSIIDTRHSEIRPRMELQLNTNKDLNAYWYHLEVVCLNTRAGTISFSDRNYAENIILKKKEHSFFEING